MLKIGPMKGTVRVDEVKLNCRIERKFQYSRVKVNEKFQMEILSLNIKDVLNIEFSANRIIDYWSQDGEWDKMRKDQRNVNSKWGVLEFIDILYYIWCLWWNCVKSWNRKRHWLQRHRTTSVRNDVITFSRTFIASLPAIPARATGFCGRRPKDQQLRKLNTLNSLQQQQQQKQQQQRSLRCRASPPVADERSPQMVCFHWLVVDVSLAIRSS